MPRQVDHAVRRRELVEALWRVARREGIGRVSVRAVAAEAGTSPSALRHYFASQQQLAAFALQAVVDRVEQRVAAMGPLRGRAGARTLLEQLLPLDDERREETTVYLAFLGAPHDDEALRRIRGHAEARSRDAVVAAVRMLAEDGALAPDVVLGAEAERLYPLVDGLALHATLWPERYPPAHVRGVLATHLAALEPR